MKPQINDLASVIAFDSKRHLQHQRVIPRKALLAVGLICVALGLALGTWLATHSF